MAAVSQYTLASRRWLLHRNLPPYCAESHTTICLNLMMSMFLLFTCEFPICFSYNKCVLVATLKTHLLLLLFKFYSLGGVGDVMLVYAGTRRPSCRWGLLDLYTNTSLFLKLKMWVNFLVFIYNKTLVDILRNEVYLLLATWDDICVVNIIGAFLEKESCYLGLLHPYSGSLF